MKVFSGLVVFSLLTTFVQADVRLPSIFGEHMVLQQGARIPVWGLADPGEKVSVVLGNAKGEAIAGPSGEWRVDLPALPQGVPAQTLVVSGKNTITLQDVLVGDVWVCSGQSNMAYELNENQARGLAEIAKGRIRIFFVSRRVGVEPAHDLQGEWKICTPESAKGFTAVGGFFAENLLPIIDRPIGLIESCWGGTRAEAWTSLSALQSHPELSSAVEDFQKHISAYSGGQAQFDRLTAAYEAAREQWEQAALKDDVYQTALKNWFAAVGKARELKSPLPPKPVCATPEPRAPTIGAATPTTLFNAMIHPLIPYAIKGVIWYQGESNEASAKTYGMLFSTMITDWRQRWGQGDFPFLYVQLPNFRERSQSPHQVSKWALLREAQLHTLSLPSTGMAITIDLGEAGNIHPRDKMNVARRLAWAARRVAYGEELVSSGPIYDHIEVQDGQVRVLFKSGSVGEGLMVAKAPKDDGSVQALSCRELKGFAVAGRDQQWFWAQAQIEGDAVVVASSQVKAPVAVRYAWADNPDCDLYNKQGLPASPFRSDNWEDPPR